MGRSSTTLSNRKKRFLSQCYCLPGVILFCVDESILESTLGRKKLRMRANCKRRAFLSQCFKKGMQTACYFVWPTLKFGEKKAEKMPKHELCSPFIWSLRSVLQASNAIQLLLQH